MRSCSGLEALFTSEYERLVSTLAIATGNIDTARDIAQDAFVQAILHWQRIKNYESPEAWIWRVALNRAANSRRNDRRRAGLILPIWRSMPADRREDTYPTMERDPDLSHAIAQLSPRQRAVVALHYFADVPVCDIAAILEVSAGTVKSHLSDARHSLARRLGVRYGS